MDVRFRSRGVRFRTDSDNPARQAAQRLGSPNGPEDYAGRGGADGAREQPGSAGGQVGPTDPDLRRRRGPRRLRVEPDVDNHQPERHLSSDRLSDDRRRQQYSLVRQLQHRRRHPAGRAVGRRALYGRHRRLAVDDEQPDQPVQSATRLQPRRLLHAALAEKFPHGRRAAESAAEPKGAGNRRRTAPADADADVPERSQRLFQPGERDRPAAGGQASRSSSRRPRSGTTTRRSNSAPSRRSTSCRRKPRSHEPRSRSSWPRVRSSRRRTPCACSS